MHRSLITALLLSTLSLTASKAPAQTTAITNINLVDGRSARPQSGMTVLISDRHIADVFRSGSKSLPPGTTVIDGTGQYLIPGLIDSHVHNATIQERTQRITELLLGNAFMGGVITVRDMGGRTTNIKALAARASLDTMPWPRIYTSAIIAGPGSWFEGARGTYMAEGGQPGAAPLVRRIVDANDIAAAITSARSAGAAGIKLYNNIDPKLIPLIVAEARKHRLRVWSHLAVDPGKPSDLVLAGVDALSHADQFLAEVLPWPPSSISRDSARAIRYRAFTATPLDTLPLQNLIAEMKKRGTALDATLFIMTPRPDSAGQIAPQAAALYRFATGMVRKANEAGVPIVAGTDHIGGSSPNLHAELQLLVERAGLTPMQALQAATINGARVLGVQDSIGTIERGKIADLVILGANPLDDIANTLTVKSVMKAGRVFHRAAPVPTPPNARAPR